VFIEENFSDSGERNPLFFVYNGSLNASFTGKLFVELLEIVTGNVFYSSISSTISEFIVRDNVGDSIISFRYNTGEENITSSENVQLNEGEEVFVFFDVNYTGTGNYFTDFDVNSSLYNDSIEGVIVV